jgi:hypothetical protein
VGVLAWGWAHYHATAKAEAIVATVKADAAKTTKAVEDYTDSEIVKLTGSLVARLTDTSGELQAKSDADASMARKAALLARLQPVVAGAAVKTS